MGLVNYSDSEEEQEPQPAAKKRRVLEATTTTTVLPPLPSNFRDLYSSTVRTSTQDDPSLHGGRKRVTPHVAGNWPTHVYLEWNPEKDHQLFLSGLIDSITGKGGNEGDGAIHSLLENDLGVQLPLHISLSRPLALKTANKDTFLANLTAAIATANLRTFKVSPATLTWHPNEDRTRWFLVLSLQRPENDELRDLLGICNRLAGEFEQPLLYQSPSRKADRDHVEDGKFHISVAWSLSPQEGEVIIPKELIHRLTVMRIGFEEVKVRIGQDVTGIPLKKRREPLFGSET